MSKMLSPIFERLQLAELAAAGADSFVDGPFGSSLKSHEYVDSGVRLIQLQNIGDGEWRDENQKFITERKFKTLERHGATPGDIAIAKMADPVARACIVPNVADQYVVVADCIRLRLDEARFDTGFIVRAINSPYTRREAENKAIGSTRVRINLSVLKTVGCLVPDLSAQQTISQILDTLDTAIRETEAIIAKLKAVKQGLLHDLLTRGIDANGELRPLQSEAPQLYKESPLGWIPKEWECVSLAKRLARITYGFTNPMPTTNHGPWMLTAADVAEGRVLYEQARHTTERAFRLLSAKSRPQVGDVLVTKDGTLGRVAVLDRDDVCVNQSVAVLSPRNSIDSLYLSTYLQSPVGQERMLADSGGSTIKHLYISKLADMDIPWPGVDESEAIASRTSGMTSRLENEKAGLSKLSQHKSGLMDDLLTGRVRVTPLLEGAATP